MKKFGFTLIELLSVILILGIIALIAIPVISKIIKESKQSSALTSTLNYIEAIEKMATVSILNNDETVTSGRHNILSLNDEIDLKGTKPTKGVLVLDEDGKVTTASFCINNYRLNYSNESVLVDESNNCNTIDALLDSPNPPELYTNMLPVTYNGTNFVYADTAHEWYNYENKQWANAVVLINNPSKNYAVGDTLLMDDIAQMYVWIPRFKYTIFNGNNGSVSVQKINIEFETGTATTGTVKCINAVSGSAGSSSETCTDETNSSLINNTSTYTHPAFTFGTTELNGIWVGKFENSVEISGSNTVQTIMIKPDVRSWQHAQVSTFFTSITNTASYYKIKYKSTYVNSHMMKNMEWGAVSYLTQSKYGRCTSESCISVSRNNSTCLYTGRSDGNNGSGIISSCEGTYVYTATSGQLASTTGNIYGIYDMSGGAYEYVMGNVVGTNGTLNISSSGLLDNMDSKYYDTYTYGTIENNQSRGKLGDATKETLNTYGSLTGGWYLEHSYFAFNSYPWLVRGGCYDNKTAAGIFNFNNYNGAAAGNISSRSVIVKN